MHKITSVGLTILIVVLAYLVFEQHRLMEDPLLGFIGKSNQNCYKDYTGSKINFGKTYCEESKCNITKSPDDCYKKIANLKKNISICELIDKRAIRVDCYWDLEK